MVWDRVGLLVTLVIGASVGVGFAVTDAKPVDADMVWRTAHASTYYGAIWAADADSRYVYPPVLAQLIAVLPVTWEVFVVAREALVFLGMWAALRHWTLPVLGVSLGGALVGGLGSPLANPLTLLLVGNIQSLVVASVVLGLRHHGTWWFGVLTKITPGLGLLWFAFRCEWRTVFNALAMTATIVLVSFVAYPQAWVDFVRFALANVSTPSPLPVIGVPLVVRLPVVVVGLAVAARSGRTWIVPLMVGFGAIALYEWSWITFAAAALPLASERRRRPSEIIGPARR